MEADIRPEIRRTSPFNGLSYFYGGTLAVIISWALATALTGCKIGNYNAQTAVPPSTTGYYGATPQSLEFCATTHATHCAQASTTQIPSFISDEISDPVALIVQDQTTGDAVLTAATGTGQTALPLWIGSDNTTLYYANSTSPQKLWTDSNCTTTLYLDENGSIVTGSSKPVPGTTAVTKGSLTLKVQVIQTFDSANGACAAQLQLMSNCYQDITQCGGANSATNQQLQTQVQSLFSTYIQAGVMTAADIPNMVNVAYEVHYQ